MGNRSSRTVREVVFGSMASYSLVGSMQEASRRNSPILCERRTYSGQEEACCQEGNQEAGDQETVDQEASNEEASDQEAGDQEEARYEEASDEEEAGHQETGHQEEKEEVVLWDDFRCFESAGSRDHPRFPAFFLPSLPPAGSATTACRRTPFGRLRALANRPPRRISR